MPSVYDYRHIELDRVGTGKKRITKPPGGEASDIFGRKLPASPNGSIVSTSPPSSPGSSSAASSAPSTPRRGSLRMEDTKNRLFGPAVTPSRKIKDHMKSNIFSGEDTADSPTPSLTPSKQRLGPVRRNPITGEVLESPGSTSGSVYESDGLRSPDTASLVNGHNIYTNGSSNGCSETCSEAGSEGGSNASLSIPSTPVTRKVRQPPGGKCSAVW